MKNEKFKIWTLQASSLWRELKSLIKEIEEERIDFDAGIDIYPLLKPEKCLFLLSGELLFFSSSKEGEKFLIGIFHKGSLIGPTSVKTERFFNLNISYPTRVSVCSSSVLQEMISQNKIALSYKKNIFSKSIKIPLSPIIGVDIVEAVFYIISYLANTISKDEKTKSIRIFPAEISKLIGARKDIVTLAIAKLKKRGWIDIMKGHIIVKR